VGLLAGGWRARLLAAGQTLVENYNVTVVATIIFELLDSSGASPVCCVSLRLGERLGSFTRFVPVTSTDFSGDRE
jgi:hypothetical protein